MLRCMPKSILKVYIAALLASIVVAVVDKCIVLSINEEVGLKTQPKLSHVQLDHNATHKNFEP